MQSDTARSSQAGNIIILLCSALLVIVALLLVGRSLGKAPAPVQQPSQLAALVFRGELRHLWLGTISDHCKVVFQQYDADLNGVMLGTPLVFTDVPVVSGTLQIPFDAQAQAWLRSNSWLTFAVQCPKYEIAMIPMAPRMHHEVTAAAWEIANRGPQLVCHIVSTPGDTPPSLDSTTYLFTGGFWIEPNTTVSMSNPPSTFEHTFWTTSREGVPISPEHT